MLFERLSAVGMQAAKGTAGLSVAKDLLSSGPFCTVSSIILTYCTPMSSSLNVLHHPMVLVRSNSWSHASRPSFSQQSVGAARSWKIRPNEHIAGGKEYIHNLSMQDLATVLEEQIIC